MKIDTCPDGSAPGGQTRLPAMITCFPDRVHFIFTRLGALGQHMCECFKLFQKMPLNGPWAFCCDPVPPSLSQELLSHSCQVHFCKMACVPRTCCTVRSIVSASSFLYIHETLHNRCTADYGEAVIFISVHEENCQDSAGDS